MIMFRFALWTGIIYGSATHSACMIPPNMSLSASAVIRIRRVPRRKLDKQIRTSVAGMDDEGHGQKYAIRENGNILTAGSESSKTRILKEVLRSTSRALCSTLPGVACQRLLPLPQAAPIS
jgi:hypothetical protein